MGFDIHGVFQARIDAQWVDIPSKYNGDRDYYLYGWLGMGGYLQPISDAKGLPSDFQIDQNNCHVLASPEILPPYKQNDFSGARDLKICMGEWGFSWLLATEIINAHKPVRQMRIWLPIDVYNEWDKVSNPKLWHELHSNWQQEELSEHYATPENITEDTWWVILDWAYDFTEDFKYFVDEVRRLMVLHGEVRFVFGFNA